MVSKLQKAKIEKQRRNFFKTNELTRRYYKFLKVNAFNIGFMPLHTLSKDQHKNYCLVTGSAHSIYRRFRLSRHQIKKYFEFITGLRLSSW